MRKILIGWVLCLSASLLTVSVGVSADISIVYVEKAQQDRIYHIELSGEIKSGDANKLELILKNENFDVGNFAGSRAIINLSSEGGSFKEGLKLAMLFSERGIETHIDSGRGCYSACAVAFMGGALFGEDNNKLSSRSVAVGAKLGFHAPYLEVNEGNYSKTVVESAYRVAILNIAELIRTTAKINIRNQLVPRILVKASSEMDVLETVDDFGEFRVSVHRLAQPRSLTRSMLANACKNGAKWWNDKEMRLLSDFDIQTRRQSMLHYEIGNQSSVGSKPTFRSVLPIFDGDEGSTGWCVVDHNQEQAGPTWHCRGVHFSTEGPEKAVAEILRLLSAQASLDAPCSGVAILNPKLGYEPSLARSSSLQLLPGNSKIADAGKVFDEYVASEPRFVRRVQQPSPPIRPQPPRRP